MPRSDLCFHKDLVHCFTRGWIFAGVALAGRIGVGIIPAMLRNPMILMITEDKAKKGGVGKEIPCSAGENVI